ncbi:hypothetical protein SOVF_205500 [Spinacia oleracea]|uniref:Uncharacterized protein n=1 Tax=Spinacia oleracea TaxID=3562 RepID=A0A9R0IAH0_SPIOL|nr:uncharacterized protein LOC110785400 [Spinacia oleracea]KNA03820.1 hypothetical protein SOVF_205500 [Spinacia oleracea]
MGLQSHNHTHKIFLLCNYILLGAASSCIFLTLSLRLFPSIVGFLFILLHVITIGGAVSGCAASSAGSHKWYAFHMVATVLTAIFQGSVAVLIFTTTGNFLQAMKSYVREEDAGVILKLAGGLCILMFCLEWVVMSLAFVLRYHAFVDGSSRGGNGNANANANGSGKEDDLKNWPWPFQV